MLCEFLMKAARSVFFLEKWGGFRGAGCGFRPLPAWRCSAQVVETELRNGPNLRSSFGFPPFLAANVLVFRARRAFVFEDDR